MHLNHIVFRKITNETISLNMAKMKLTVLGSGSALPTEKRYNTSHILSIGEKNFMIDCGEGSQIKLRQYKIRTAKLNHIFITHLHGDHCFGLIGFISTMAMMNRKENLYIHAHADLEKLLQPQIDYFTKDMSFKVVFNHINPRKNEVVFEDKSLKVSSIPLKHGIPCCGFLFEEKEKERSLIKEKAEFYNIPIKKRHLIKKGADLELPTGKIVPNKEITLDPEKTKSFAFCSDTMPIEKIIPIIENVDLLYHEATFAEEEKERAKETYHSTAKQAAKIAQTANIKKLVVGHYSARYRNSETIQKEAREIFKETYAAEDGSVFEI